jgi:Ca2+-binding EF-hand superfamily protein
MTTSQAIAGRVGFALVCVLIAAAAQAQDADRAKQMAAEMQKRFAAADKNGDGRLTREEAQGGMPYVYKHFDAIDKNKQGSISLAEIAAFAREQRAARKGTTP